MLTGDIGLNIEIGQLQEEPFAEAEIQINAVEIPRIQAILTIELENLKNQSEILADKIEDLYKPQHCFSTLNTPLRNLAFVITTLKITTMIGIFLTATNTHSSTLQWSGIALVIFSTWFEGGLNFYQQRLSLRQKQILELVAQNRYETIQGQKYKEFAQKLEITTKLMLEHKIDIASSHPDFYTEKREPSPLHPAPPSSSRGSLVDNQISDCLQSYENLPLAARREDAYCRIVSELIKRLPSTDPVAQAFLELSAEANQEDLGKLAEMPLSNKYLPRTTSIGKGDEYWDSEDLPNFDIGLSSRSLEMREPSQTMTADKNNKQCMLLADKLSKLVKERFGLKKEIPYFETMDGWRVSSREGACNAGGLPENSPKGSSINKSYKPIHDPLESV